MLSRPAAADDDDLTVGGSRPDATEHHALHVHVYRLHTVVLNIRMNFELATIRIVVLDLD